MKNKSIDKGHTWKENGLTFIEVIRQEYSGNNYIICLAWVSSGVVWSYLMEEMNKKGD